MSRPVEGVRPAQWAKHLRPFWRREFWKRVRAGARRLLRRTDQW